LPEGPWPPSEVLAADPATTPVPEVASLAATSCPPVGYGVNRSAPGTGKTVALTFDDGPGASTAAILQILRNERVTATFFNIGVNQAVRPSLVQDEAAQGFLLGNHTWGHPDMATLSSAAQAQEMDQATAQQISLVGSAPCFFRPPYGSYNSTTLSLAQARNMSVWNWSVDTEDWKAAGSGSSYWVNRIISLAQAGGSQTHPVVLMHNAPAGNPATVAALPTIIKYYRDRGYTFVDLAGGTGNRLPIGHSDSVAIDAAGVLRVNGWAVDPDTPTQPVSVHLYVDGGGRALTANESRPDVGAVYPWAGSQHGYSAAVPVAPGSHQVCLYAIDTSVSWQNTVLSCGTVTATTR
jgi:peptidoglycan/xylan/chitin deacetylase (PgdA/CDA1 family)